MLTQKGLARINTLLLLFPLLWSGVTAAPMELSLREALERAPGANFHVLLAREGVTTQTEAVRAARSALLPQVRLEATQRRAMAPNVDPFSKQFAPVSRYYVDRFDAVLRARLSLLNSRSLDDWRLSRLELRATGLGLENTVQDILARIATAYVSHWRNQRRLEVIDATLIRDRILLQIATDLKDAGVATALDVTRAELGLAGNELARLQQETLVLESALDILRALNLPLDSELSVQGSLAEMLRQAVSPDPSQLDTVLARRADYQQLLAEVDRESLALSAARREHLPSLEVGAEWGYASEAWSDPMEEQWGIQLRLSMPVFEGFRIDARKRMTASALKQKELQLEDLRDQIEADYRLVVQQVESSLRQVEVAQRARRLNLREFELERIRFQEGVADNSDVTASQAKLADSEDALVEAEFQFLLAKIRWARTQGNVLDLLNQPLY
jgi:outer membrane protein